MPTDLTQELSPDKVLEAQLVWRSNPEYFAKTLFNSVLWDKQIEVMNSVRDNPKTAAKSGNTTGKSYDAALIAMWFLLSHYPSKVITTAPGWNQVENILWKEIASLSRKATILGHPIGGQLLASELKLNEEWFAIGISTDDVNRMQGFHSPYLLVIIDEALGVPPMIWEAIQSLHPYRVLAIGNPLDPIGDFYNCFSSPLWHKITVSCLDCVKWQDEHGKIPGLVSREWIEEMRSELGEGAPLYQARVLGEFPEDIEATLIKRQWVEEARNRDLEETEEDSIKIEACDVASKHGDSETVKTYRYGHTFKNIKAYQRIPTTETRDILSHDYLKLELNDLVIDADGLGEGLDDMLREKNVPFYDFHGGYGQKALDSEKYKNLRTQFYLIVAKKFEKGLYDLRQLPQKEYEILKNQLCCIRVKPHDAMGRMQIETKEDLQARSIKSPDFSDSFMMTEYGFWMDRCSDIKPFAYR